MEALENEWSKDSKMDLTDYVKTVSDIPLLHHKYNRYYYIERKEQRRIEVALDKLKIEAERFYAGNNTKEDQERGWKLPPWGASEKGNRRNLLKAEIEKLVNTNTDVVELTLQLADQIDKVEFLESILKELGRRGFGLHDIMEYWKLHGIQ